MTTTDDKRTRPTLQQLTESIIVWQKETFPLATGQSVVEHLRREAAELWQEFWETRYTGIAKEEVFPVEVSPVIDDVAEEAADVFFMLVSLSHVVGFDLRDAVAAKYRKNMARKWKAPDEHGVVEHVKE